MSNGFPPPPGFAKQQSVQTEQPLSIGPDTSTNDIDVPDTDTTDEDTLFILKQYLLPKQFSDKRIITFVLHYITYRSSPDAAEAAGFDRQRGSYYRSRPEIHAVIEALTAKAVMKHGYDAAEMVERAKEIAIIDPIEFQNPDGSFKTHMSEIRAEARRTIKEFTCKNIFSEDANGMKVVVGQLINVKLHDKLKSIEMLGGDKNVFKKTTVIEHDITSNMSQFLLESGRRADERKLLVERQVSGEGGEEGRDRDVRERRGERVLITERSSASTEDIPDGSVEAVFTEVGTGVRGSGDTV